MPLWWGYLWSYTRKCSTSECLNEYILGKVTSCLKIRNDSIWSLANDLHLLTLSLSISHPPLPGPVSLLAAKWLWHPRCSHGIDTHVDGHRHIECRYIYKYTAISAVLSFTLMGNLLFAGLFSAPMGVLWMYLIFDEYVLNDWMRVQWDNVHCA